MFCPKRLFLFYIVSVYIVSVVFRSENLRIGMGILYFRVETTRLIQHASIRMLQKNLFLEKLEVGVLQHGRSVCNLIPKNRHSKWHYTENSLIHPSNHPEPRQTPSSGVLSGFQHDFQHL